MPGLTLPSTPEGATTALSWLERQLEEVRVEHDLMDRALLAAGEAVANAVEHGSGGRPDATFQIGFEVASPTVTVWVTDEGRGVPSERLASPSLPSDYDTGGRGLYLMRSLSEAVEVESGTVRMAFRPRPPGSE